MHTNDKPNTTTNQNAEGDATGQVATVKAIKALPGMTADRIDGEWRVSVTFCQLLERNPEKTLEWCEAKQEAMAYYTDDAADAL